MFYGLDNVRCDQFYSFVFVAAVCEQQCQWDTNAKQEGMYLETLFNPLKTKCICFI
jgi:hypothetical protein